MQSKSNKCIMHIDMPPPPFGSIGRRQARARGANNRVDLQIFLSPSHIGADHAYARRLLSAWTNPHFFRGDFCGGVIITQAWSPAFRIRNGAIFPSRKSRNGECINSTVVLIRPRGRHALTLPHCTALPSVFSIPSPTEEGGTRSLPSMQIALRILYISESNLGELCQNRNSSFASSPPPAGRSGSRSRPPSRQPSQRVTVRPRNRGRRARRRLPRKSKCQPACLFLDHLPPRPLFAVVVAT